MKPIVAVLVTLLLLAVAPARAEPVSLQPGMPVSAPVERAALLQDPDGTLPVEAVLTGLHDAAFDAIDGSSSVGPTSSVWWLRLPVRNPTAEPVDWVIVFPFPLTDFVDVYQTRGGSMLAYYPLGDERPAAYHPLPAEGFAAPLTTAPGAVDTVYVRFDTRYGDAVDPYFEIASPEAFAVKQQHIWTLLGAFVGGAVVLFLYNFVIWLTVRTDLYFWYLAYFGAAILTVMTASGMGNRFLWAPSSPLGEAAPPFLSALTLALVVQFSRRFLETKANAPRLDRFLIAAMGYFVLPPAAFLMGQGALAAKLVMLGGLGLSPLLVYSAWRWWQGHTEARIFTIAWAVWFLSVGTIMGRVLGVVPSGDYSIRTFWFGVLAEAILFAFALAERIRVLQREKTAAEHRERQGLARAKAELEEKVAERTAELREKNAALDASNTQKDRLFSIVAHDLMSPFNVLLGMTELLKTRAMTLQRGQIADYAADVNEAAGGLHKLLDNLLTWSRLQRGDLTFTVTEIDLALRAKRTLDLFRPVAAQKDVRLVYAGPQTLPCRADPNAVDTVLRNLVSNAIKFSHPDGTVEIDGGALAEGGVSLSIADQGIGMSAAVQETLFRLGARPSAAGTLGETGTGLGLRLCHELLTQHGGSLDVRSAEGDGTTMTLTLPREAVAAA